MKRLSLPNYVRRSGAKFESTERFLNSTEVVDTTEKELKSAGVPLTRIDGNMYATTKDEIHCFVIGESGCGKTRRVILPTIHLMAKTGQSMVLSDPKGELYRTTADSLRKKGYSVMVLNFRNPSRGNRWNPLGQIEKLYRTGDPENKDKAAMMLSDIVNVLSQSIEGKDPYWAMAAASVFRGISYTILDYGKEGDLTFENIALGVREIINEFVLNRMTREKEPSARLKAFLDVLPKNSQIINGLSCIVTNAEETRNCIISTFESMISLYSSQESLLDLFSCSEIDVNRLGLEPTALFIVLPDDNESLYPIATVFVKQIYSALIALADEQLKGVLPNRVTFLLDEFANFAKMPSIESMLTAARSRGIRFVLVCQSMDQLTAKYQDHGRETLLANCRTWIYMSCRNLPFLQRLEQLMGYYISPYTNEKTPLVDIGDLQHFEMGQVLVLNDRCRPVMGFLEDFDKYDFGENERGDIIALPEKHEMKARVLFNLQDALLKGEKFANKEERDSADSASPWSTETDSLRASILGKLAERKKEEEERATTFLAPSFEDFIRQLEGQDDKGVSDDDDNNENDFDAIDTDHAIEENSYEKMMELFSEGNYKAAAETCINCIVDGEASISLKNNLAFLLRFAKIDSSTLKAPFSLEISDLLKEGVEEREAFSLMNMALFEIEHNNFDNAISLLEKIPDVLAWMRLNDFWVESLWEEKRNAEGALVFLIIKKYQPHVIGHDNKMAVKAAMSVYPEFFEEKLAEFKSDGDGQTELETVEEANSSWLDTLLSDDDYESDDDDIDDDNDNDDDNSEDISVLKAQLQKRIQAQLKAHQDDEEE